MGVKLYSLWCQPTVRTLRGFTSKSPQWTFILLLVWTLGEGLNSGSSQPVISAAGLDVVLPCRLDPPIDVQGFAVEWSKLKPGASPQHPQTTVYLYRDGKEEARETIRPYVGRTQMFPDQLEHGNMSLRILNVTSADAGRYRCKCLIQAEEEDADVQLVVDPDLKTSGTTNIQNSKTDDKGQVDQIGHIVWIVPVVCCFFFFVLIVIVIGFLIKQQRQNQTQNKRDDVEYHAVPLEEPLVDLRKMADGDVAALDPSSQFVDSNLQQEDTS